MIVDVYNDCDAKAAVSLHFDAAPKIGDMVALEGMHFRVSSAWHQPNAEWSGARIAIVLEKESAPHWHPRFGGSWE